MGLQASVVSGNATFCPLSAVAALTGSTATSFGPPTRGGRQSLQPLGAWGASARVTLDGVTKEAGYQRYRRSRKCFRHLVRSQPL